MMASRAAVEEQLSLLDVDVHDVLSDGNCLFRAASYAAYGTEEKHDELRAKTASYVVSNKDLICFKFGLEESDFNKVVHDVSVLKEPVGEHALSVLPVILNRDVIVHVAYTEPLLLSASSYETSATSVHLPIQLAFYDGLCGGAGHYKAVLSHCPPPLPCSQDQQSCTCEEGIRCSSLSSFSIPSALSSAVNHPVSSISSGVGLMPASLSASCNSDAGNC
jgi:hypothetical protein